MAAEADDLRVDARTAARADFANFAETCVRSVRLDHEPCYLRDAADFFNGCERGQLPAELFDKRLKGERGVHCTAAPMFLSFVSIRASRTPKRLRTTQSP